MFETEFIGIQWVKLSALFEEKQSSFTFKYHHSQCGTFLLLTITQQVEISLADTRGMSHNSVLA